MTRKKCPYCLAFFIPTPRGGGKRQRVCEKPSCKQALKAENNAQWRWENPNCWRNDYPRVKQWLDQHPGYLKHYQANHPNTFKRIGRLRGSGTEGKESILIYKPKEETNSRKSLNVYRVCPFLIYKTRKHPDPLK